MCPSTAQDQTSTLDSLVLYSLPVCAGYRQGYPNFQNIMGIISKIMNYENGHIIIMLITTVLSSLHNMREPLVVSRSQAPDPYRLSRSWEGPEDSERTEPLKLPPK